MHHFPTHSQVWEVHETTWDCMEDISVRDRSYFFEDRHGNIMMVLSHFFLSKSEALLYWGEGNTLEDLANYEFVKLS